MSLLADTALKARMTGGSDDVIGDVFVRSFEIGTLDDYAEASFKSMS